MKVNEKVDREADVMEESDGARLEERGFAGFCINPPDYTEMHCVDNKSRQCVYAANRLATLPSGKLLDIGSYLDMVIGMSAHSDVTMLDVRDMGYDMSPLKMVQCDAKEMSLGDESFDIVTSLCTLEHLGTKAFGDELDVDADIKMVDEVARVLKPEGDFIFTTQVNDVFPLFMMNCHRIYTTGQIHDMLADFECLDERYLIKHGRGSLATPGTAEDTKSKIAGSWGFYLAHWRKK